ncbi:Uncharacterised protein [BD1-7 clade bacterium]|uniref:Uncharacterized protein n=1 Tax=BD1-7 clade bacterium TaxID=2029982 RepID=A0A5S9Q9G8_9GAMM|nr:Uncharacterised protein [BD1-7 clade bacterium]
MGARKIHKGFKDELPLIARLRLEGAFGWVMSKEDVTKTRIYSELQKEFTRQIQVL